MIFESRMIAMLILIVVALLVFVMLLCGLENNKHMTHLWEQDQQLLHLFIKKFRLEYLEKIEKKYPDLYDYLSRYHYFSYQESSFDRISLSQKEVLYLVYRRIQFIQLRSYYVEIQYYCREKKQPDKRAGQRFRR